MTDQTQPDEGQSEAVENFLKAVYTLQQQSDRVSTNSLADALGKKAPSITDMAQRLVEDELVDYRKYYGVRLTDAGEKIALKIIRRHRLIELYLVQELGYALYEVHDDAEALEHAVSDRFIEAIANKLGDPAFDPHGDPIPTADGRVRRRSLQPLSELTVGATARVSRLMSVNSDMLKYALENGFILGAEVEVMDCAPFEGPVTVLLDGEKRVIGHNVAHSILVEVDE